MKFSFLSRQTVIFLIFWLAYSAEIFVHAVPTVVIGSPSDSAAVTIGQAVTVAGGVSENSYKSLGIYIDGSHYKDICRATSAGAETVARTHLGTEFNGSVALQVWIACVLHLSYGMRWSLKCQLTISLF